MRLYNVVKDSPLDQRLCHSSEQGTTWAVTLQTEEVCRRTSSVFLRRPPGAAGPSPPWFPGLVLGVGRICTDVMRAQAGPRHWLCDRGTPHSLFPPHTLTLDAGIHSRTTHTGLSSQASFSTHRLPSPPGLRVLLNRPAMRPIAEAWSHWFSGAHLCHLTSSKDSRPEGV